MLRNFKRFTLQVVAGANLATIFMMLFVGFSDRFNPVNHQVLANAGLVFPVFLAINFGFLLALLQEEGSFAFSCGLSCVLCARKNLYSVQYSA